MLVAPSLLAADFSKLKEEIQAVEAAGADWLHLDIMDGHFVPNISFGASLVKSLRPHSKLVFDAHLMVADPSRWVESFAETGVEYLTVHQESTHHLDRVLSQIKSAGMQVGVSLNPATSERTLEYVLDKVDLILVMSVNPGFGGQKFLDSQLLKISRIRKMLLERNLEHVKIQVDGGVNLQNCEALKKAGADVLVAGSAIFKTDCYQRAIQKLR